jgi:predicted nucleic-acid-binding Zn-ribbon protein
MKSGICPKCGKTKVVMRDDGFEAGGSRLIFNLGILAQATCNVYVCVACGYSETYVAYPEDRERLRDSKLWQRVKPS